MITSRDTYPTLSGENHCIFLPSCIKIKRKAPVLLLKTCACTGAAKLRAWFTFAFPEFTLTTPPLSIWEVVGTKVSPERTHSINHCRIENKIFPP